MRWHDRRVLAVEGAIRAGESRDAPGVVLPHAGWLPAQDCDRVILRLDGDYVCAVPVLEIRQYAEEMQQLRRLAEIALVCAGAGRCHGELHWCEGCDRDVLDVCDIGDACPQHGEEAKKRRVEQALAWLDSLDRIGVVDDPDKKDAD